MSDPTTVELIPGWDAALTYDVLAAGDEAPVFVGREDLIGPLVNAIGQPDRRGTYLVSGYRGAGKTSLVIEAARRGKVKLAACDRRLLPLVLNVSEVSASLESAEDRQMPPLGIDARRLLTALLRALRNGLPDDDPVARMVARAYAKAEASQYSETAQERAEAARTVAVETSLSAAVPNVLKAVAAIAGVGVVSVGVGALLGVVPAVLTGLAGLAAISFRASRTTSRRTADTTVSSTELVRDNSLHQVESDLKDILAALDAHGWRTMFVLEELDKVEDAQGQQLDAVIRYFKNLFTQAPALFFFLTDKEYFDIIDANIASARRRRSYAVEHTFFTHRVFVSRPSLDECLAYFDAVLVGDEAHEALEHIAATRQARSLPLGDMKPVERFMRVLLFQSSNHLFDLKNEMRRFVRVDGDASWLVFDAQSLPAQEQAVAALQFLLEQKALLFRFGGGRDYANEVLRNCLSSVFWNLGGEEPQPLDELFPGAAELRTAERARVVEAVASLLADLDRGGAIQRGEDHFVWKPALAFTPAPVLEGHEQALKTALERATRICAQFVEGGPLEGIAGPPELARARIDVHAATLQDINRGSLTVEETQRLAATVDSGLEPLLTAARAAHQNRLRASGWVLTPAGGGVLGASREGYTGLPRLLLAYGTAVQRTLEPPPGVTIALVLVDDDPEPPAAEHGPGPSVLVARVSLGEGLETGADVAERWGERTAEEFVLARMWLGQRDRMVGQEGPDVPSWLDERRFDSLPLALEAWLAGDTALLGAPPRAGGDSRSLVRALADLAPTTERPVLGLDGSEWLLPPIVDDDHVVRERLIAAGRLATILNSPYVVPSPRSILVFDPAPPDAGPLSLLLVGEAAQALRALAEFIEPVGDGRADALIERAAEAGDPDAIGRMALRTGAQDWRDRLLSTGDWGAIVRTADALPQEHGTPLLQAAADAGSAEGMASLMIRVPTEQLAERLIATHDWAAVRRAAGGLPGHEIAGVLLGAAADGGDPEALEALVGGGATDRDEALLAAGDSLRLWRVGVALDEAEPERALRFHRAAADKGDPDSMREVVVRGDEDESRVNQVRLVELGDWPRLEAAEARMDGERAADLRALMDAGRDSA